MAIVADSRTLENNRLPFLKPPDMSRMQSPMPRAMMNCVLHNSGISAKPINDQQTLTVAVDLDPSFAYRMIACEITIVQDVAFAWQFGAELQVSSALRGVRINQIFHHSMVAVAESFTTSPIVQQVHYAMSRLPTYIMQGRGAGFAPIVNWRMVNNSAPAGAVGTVSALVRFYEYDIEQVQGFPPLVPGSLVFGLEGT